MEKVHSAVIGWLLSDKCEAFGKGDSGRRIRSELLQRIFGISESFKVFDTIDSILEWKNIDILVVTNRGKIDEKCWVIENKIKSSQHSDQLTRYANIMNCDYLMSSRQYLEYFKNPDPNKYVDKGFNQNPYKNKGKEYCFLTLIKEKPISANGINWKSTQYSDLSKYLDRALKKTGNSNNKDYLFVQEYLNCITELDFTIKVFLEDHRNYPNVFDDGWKPKEEKPKGYTGLQKFICDNGLETIFQKCFLSFIIPQTKFAQFNEYNVSETHGTALVDFPHKTIGNARYGFQFQNGTFKIQIVEEYNGTKQAIKKKVNAFINKWEKYFSSKNNGPREPIFINWDLNKSKENKKAYISICRHKRRNTKKNPQKPWYDNSIKDIKKTWDNAFIDYMSMMENVIIPKNTLP